MIYIKDDAKIMANLLRTGYKMLNKSCPVCNNPIFKNKSNKMFCPICNREVIIVNNEDSIIETNIDKGNKISKNSNSYDVLLSLRDVTNNKIKVINDLLAIEDHMDNIKKYTMILLNLLKILRYIELIAQDHKKV